MLSSLKDLSFTFMLSQFTYLSPPQEANTCVNCALIPTYLHIALVILLYVDNYPWDIHVTSWKQPLKLNLPLCCFNAFTMNLLLYELTLMQDLLMLVLKYYSWKVFTIWFSCLLMSFTLFWSLHSLHMLTIVWSRLWWHVTPEIIFVIVYLLGTSRN